MPLVHTPGAEIDASERQRQARKIKPQYADGPLVKVAYAKGQPEAEFIAGLLLEEGIPCLLRNSIAGYSPTINRCDVMVPESGADAAREALNVRRTTNVYASPKRFEIDKDELFGAYKDFGAEAWEIGAIYHSHTHTAPYPSQTDINFAAKWPGVEWVIVGLGGDQPEVRCYFIDGATVREVPLEVR